jgi:hypothetical protein
VLVVGCCMVLVRRTGLVLVRMDQTGRSIGVGCCLDRGLNAVGSWDQLVGPSRKVIGIK